MTSCHWDRLAKNAVSRANALCSDVDRLKTASEVSVHMLLMSFGDRRANKASSDTCFGGRCTVCKFPFSGNDVFLDIVEANCITVVKIYTISVPFDDFFTDEGFMVSFPSFFEWGLPNWIAHTTQTLRRIRFWMYPSKKEI